MSDDLGRLRAQLDADDALLDLLGAGGDPPPGDEVARLLAVLRDSAPQAPVPRGRHRAARRWPRVAAVAAAMVLLAGGILGAGTVQARPGDPMWPVARVLDRDRAAELAAQAKLDDARAAAGQGETARAGQLLDEAAPLVGAVRDRGRQQRLLAEWTQLHDALAATKTPGPSAPPSRAAPSGQPPAGPRLDAPAATDAGVQPSPAPAGSATPGPTPAPATATGGLVCLLHRLLPILPCL